MRVTRMLGILVGFGILLPPKIHSQSKFQRVPAYRAPARSNVDTSAALARAEEARARLQASRASMQERMAASNARTQAARERSDQRALKRAQERAEERASEGYQEYDYMGAEMANLDDYWNGEADNAYLERKGVTVWLPDGTWAGRPPTEEDRQRAVKFKDDQRRMDEMILGGMSYRDAARKIYEEEHPERARGRSPTGHGGAATAGDVAGEVVRLSPSRRGGVSIDPARIRASATWEDRVAVTRMWAARDGASGVKSALSRGGDAEIYAALLAAKENRIAPEVPRVSLALRRVKDERAARAAIWTLRNENSPEARRALAEHVLREGPGAEMARKALGAEAKTLVDAARKEQADRWMSMVRNNHADRVEAIEKLGGVPGQDVTVFLKTLRSDWSPRIREAAEKALQGRESGG